MDKRGTRIGRVLSILGILVIVLVGIFAEDSWAQVPTIVSITPADKFYNAPVNAVVTVQFSISMDTTTGWIGLRDEYDNDIAGDFWYRKTVYDNDTLTFRPNQSLRPATHYRVDGIAWSAGGIGINGYNKGFRFSFITKPSSADTTPPTVQTVYPYNGMTGVSTTTKIYCVFSEAMNPSSINSTNITLAGPGISSPSDYTVNYGFENGPVVIRKNNPLAASSTYSVTITTNVKDLRGNWLKEQYQWSFTTGSSDTTAPAVTQTIPANGATEVSPYSYIYAVFSEEMDTDTFNTANISFYDNTGGSGVSIYILEKGEDYVTIIPSYGIQLQNGHNYTLTLGTGVKDLAGNGLSTPYSRSFTVADVGVDSAPILYEGIARDNQIGERWSDGSSRLEALDRCCG